MTECLLLPKEAYPGSPPVSIVGEVMLQELEDDEETRTQLFFKSDGTIGHGSTDARRRRASAASGSAARSSSR